VSKHPPTVARLSPELAARLYRQAGASRWGLSEASLVAALELSAAKALGGHIADAKKVERYLDGLHLQDLALACACAEGIDVAWDHFVVEFRPVLYRSADALEPGGAAREQADSLYAELFGLREREGERASLLRYFHGRSSLATWLRAVLAQRYVDRVRSQRRTTPLDEEETMRPIAAPSAPVDPDARRFAALIKIALLQCLTALADRDRLRLSCYYRENLTLAQIGKILGEHEATVSRQLAKTRKAIRDEVERWLRREHGLGEAEIGRCFECTIEDPGTLDLGELLGSATARKDPAPERST
jgi:RNA polymerase sigma-70 factor, ECF subfamily